MEIMPLLVFISNIFLTETQNVVSQVIHTYYMWKCDFSAALCDVCTGQLVRRAHTQRVW